jgi:hypothetical protein
MLTAVASLWSTLDGVRGCPVLGPRGAETGTLRHHATTLRRGQALSPSKYVCDDRILLERCSATSAGDKMPLLPPKGFPSTSQITWPLLQASESLLCGTLLILRLHIPALCHSGLCCKTSWRDPIPRETSSSELGSRDPKATKIPSTERK